MPDSSAFNDRPELPDADAELYAATVAEGCPQDFPPAQEARPATKTQTATARPRRQPKPKPTAQDELAVQDAYFASLKPADGSGVEAVQPMRFLTLEEAANLESGDYTIKHLFPAQGVVLLFGEPACFKSFTLMSAAGHISEGWRFGGRRVRKRPVYYLALEGSGGLARRIQAFKAWALKTGKPEMKGVFRFWTHGFALTDAAQCDALIKTILDAGHQGAVVVVDTLSQSTLGLDENSSQMAEAVGNAAKIADAIGGLVVLIHHVGKDSTKGPRGHSSLMGNVDCAIFAHKSKGMMRAEWTVHKAKDDADGQAVGFKIHVFELGLDSDGETVTSCAADPSDAPSSVQAFNELGGKTRLAHATIIANRALETALHSIGAENGGAVHRDVWKEEFIRTYPGGKDKDSKASEFYRQAKLMAANGWIVVDNDMVSFYRPSVPASDGEQQQREQR